jgi:hypothetical protein
MAAIHDYPLIAVTEVFDMPSVDNLVGEWGTSKLGPTIDILEGKLSDVLGEYGYGWSEDTEFDNPIHIVEYNGPGTGDTYGHSLDDSYRGCKLMGNGHHRLAFQALVQGALFVPYCDNMRDSGW